MTKKRILIAVALAFLLLVAGCQQPGEYFTESITKIKGAIMLDNPMDQIVMTIQGHSTQTSSLVVAEQSDGTDVYTLSNAGAAVFASSVTGDSLVCTEGATFGGGYGSTGCTISTAGVLQCDGAVTGAGALTVDSIVCTNAATFGGGYGATGCTISTAGVLQCNGAATTDGALTADNVVCTNAATFGGGYGSTGATVSTAGVGQFNGALTTDGALTGDSVAIGGGYGATGCTISAAGVLQCNGAATTDGALTADNVVCTNAATFGGGYGSTGATISTAGVGQFNDALTTDGALTADNVVCTNAATFGGGYGSTGATISTAGVIQADGAATFATDVTISNDSTGGNAGATSNLIGLPRLALVDLAQGTNPGAETVDCMDTTPTGEWTEIDAGTNLDVGADTGYYRYDTNSIKLTVATVADNDGVQCALPAQDDLTNVESVGFWIYSDEAITSGDLDLTVDDSDGTDQTYTIGAVSANVWTWVEVDVSACDANCDTTDNFHILFTAQGAGNLTDPAIYIDELFYWDAADEETLGQAIVDKGVVYVMTIPTAAGTNNTWGVPAEYTDYIIHYETGNDFIVWITDQSANEALALIAY